MGEVLSEQGRFEGAMKIKFLWPYGITNGLRVIKNYFRETEDLLCGNSSKLNPEL